MYVHLDMYTYILYVTYHFATAEMTCLLLGWCIIYSDTLTFVYIYSYRNKPSDIIISLVCDKRKEPATFGARNRNWVRAVPQPLPLPSVNILQLLIGDRLSTIIKISGQLPVYYHHRVGDQHPVRDQHPVGEQHPVWWQQRRFKIILYKYLAYIRCPSCIYSWTYLNI
jgi:hypothetical protein